MKVSVLKTAVILCIGMAACNTPNAEKANLQTPVKQKVTNQKPEVMENLISIVEIPTADFNRAVEFYQTLLDVSIEEVDMGGIKMGVLPGDDQTVNVALVNGSDYIPTATGAVLYLNAGKDLQPMLDKAEQNGASILVPKTEISPEIGYFALFIDTEGNKMGLHSTH